MRPAARLTLFALLVFPVSAGAQESQGPSPALIHISHLTEHFAGTPDGQGLLPTAIAEARVVVQHAGLGARDPSNLDAMKLHAGHVINAIDPKVIADGPGAGYGLIRAAENVAKHAELAAKSEGATQAIMTHSVHVATSARNTVHRAQQILALAQTIRQYAETPEEAAAIFADLKTVADELLPGLDANGDGRVGWQDGEGGLDQVQQHVGFMAGSN